MRHVLLIIGFWLYSVEALAISFLSFDAKTMATGGAGAMTGIAGAMPHANPSTWRAAYNDFDSGLYLGARVIDRENFIETVENFETLTDTLRIEDQLERVKRMIRAGSVNTDALRTLSDMAEQMVEGVESLPNKPLRLGAAAGAFAAGSSEMFSLALFTSEYVVLGARVTNDPADIATVHLLTDATVAVADVIDSGKRLEDSIKAVDWPVLEDLVKQSIEQRAWVPELEAYETLPGVSAMIADFERFIADLEALNAHLEIEDLAYTILTANLDNLPEGIALPGIDVRDYLRYPLPSQLNSRVVFTGAEVSETGLNVSLPVKKAPGLVLGVNLKEVHFSTIGFVQAVDNFDVMFYEHASTRRDYRFWNMDIGAQYAFAKHWRLGAAVKGVVRKNLYSVLGQRVAVKPLLRAGILYENRLITFAVDMDLTKNEPLGFDPHKQFLSVGGELRLFNQALRYGYRYNCVDKTGLPALGLGLSLGPAALELAATYDEVSREAGAGVQLGLVF